MSDVFKIALQETEAILALAESIMAQLESRRDEKPDGDYSMAPRHAAELYQYLDAYRCKLVEWRDTVTARLESEAPPPVSFASLLSIRNFEFDAAIRFVREAFINPRRSGPDAGTLEAADWLCVEGFQFFLNQAVVNPNDYPVGPIVALDSQRSPAIWREDAELRIPSLFGGDTIPRGGGDSGVLAAFPVICLPSDLARLPEYYALLSHEIGHAVDTALGLSKELLDHLKGIQFEKYWRSWMREMVADAVGLTLSGEAFAFALWRFVQRSSLDREVSPGNPYPPTELRLAFLRAMIARTGAAVPEESNALPRDEVLLSYPRVVLELKREFESQVMPLLEKQILSKAVAWREEQGEMRSAVAGLVKKSEIPIYKGKFRLVPAIFTLAMDEAEGSGIRALFADWYSTYRQQTPPEWITSQTNWIFREELIPTLRPTLLGSDGRTKVPPVVLLASHRKIAFVGATNKWLLDALEEAIELRGKVPWERLDVFFASDALLKQVERYAPPEMGGRRIPTADLIKERDKHLRKLKKFFKKRPEVVKKCRFYLFGGSPVFGSFWDWDQRFGRIHISAQLFGSDISVCPGTDHLWIHDHPTLTYDCYRKHLETLYLRAKPV